jgi:hypothetical protein
MIRVDRRFHSLALALVIVGALALPASALAEETKQAGREAGIGLATVVANIFYKPAKVGYAAVGGITGGLTYALTAGNLDAAEKVWVASGGGDYVLSPEHLQGRDKIQFSGTRPSSAPSSTEF